MNNSRRFFVVFLSLLFFSCALPALCVIPAELTLFRANVVQKSLIKHGFYNQLPGLIAEEMYFRSGQIIENEVVSQALMYLREDDYRSIVDLLFTRDWLENQGEAIVRQIWGYLNFRQDKFTLSVDLQPVIDNINSGDNLSRIAKIVLYSWPPCQTEDLLRLGNLILSGDLSDIPFCLPPEELVSEVLPYVDYLLNQVNINIPGSIDLAETIHLDSQRQEQLDRIFDIYRWIRIAGYIAIPLSFVLLIWILLVVRHWQKEIFFWGGISILQAGLAGVFNAILIAGAGYFFTNRFINDSGSGESMQVAISVMQVFKDLTLQFALWLALFSLATTFIGTVSFFWSVMKYPAVEK